jgi:hypothetical protein
MSRLAEHLQGRAGFLLAFLSHYTDCDDCGAMSTDVDDPAAGDLCPEGLRVFQRMHASEQVGLTRLAALHMHDGAVLALEGEGLERPPVFSVVDPEIDA